MAKEKVRKKIKETLVKADVDEEITASLGAIKHILKCEMNRLPMGGKSLREGDEE